MKDIFQIFISLFKIIIKKIQYGRRLRVNSFKQKIKLDSEIMVGKEAILSIGSLSVQNNVHLVSVKGELVIGDRVSFNRNCIIVCRQSINIGDDCLFGPNVCVYDHDHAYSSEGVRRQDFKSSEIIIESGCWIGAGAIILRGTHIGKNSIIGAGTIIKGEIPANSVVRPHVNNIVETIQDKKNRIEV